MSNIRARLDRIVNSSAAWCIGSIELFLKRWTAFIQRSTNPFNQYIEGMLAEFAELRRLWQQQGYSEAQILLRLLLVACDFLRGVTALAWRRMMHAISTLAYGLEQLVTIQNASQSAAGLLIQVLQELHQITGSAGRHSSHARLHLSSSATITYWDRDAEALFGFNATEIVGHQAIETFIPAIETGGRKLTDLISKVCTVPHQYSLNLNENQDREGTRFWMFWINVPQYNSNQELVEVICLGLRVEDPELLKLLVKFWQSWRQPRLGFCPIRR